jgi:hypothetical protein
MAIQSSVVRTNQLRLARLRTLRSTLDQARNALMHFKDDRVDRDKLEPAARRVDDLMNLYGSGTSDPTQSLAWMNEIRVALGVVVNPKSATALQAASDEIDALLALETPAEPAAVTGGIPPA